MISSRRVWLTAGLAVLAFGAREGRAEPVCAAIEDSPPPVQACVQPVAARTGSAGMEIYRNPVTGAFEAPPEGAAPDASARVPQAAPPPLVERMGVTPGGGVMLDNIPMMGMTTTIDATGKASTRCNDDPAHGERRP
jgi:hypothetical protein